MRKRSRRILLLSILLTTGLPGSGQPEGEPLGETFLLGTTWYDIQHHGTIGRMISMTPAQGLHFCWMNGLDEGATGRHVYYNYFANGILMWPGVGFGPLDQRDRGGYCTVSYLGEGEAVVAFHNWGVAKHSKVAVDFYEGSGFFHETDVENVPDVGELIWPKVAVCNRGNIHLVAFEYTDLYWSSIAYARSEYGGS